MEQEVGRKLGSNEIVHHKNEDKLDNGIDNLEILTRSEHAKLHAKPPYFTEEVRERARQASIGRPSPGRKLTAEDVRTIKESYIPRDKENGGRALARKYGVDHTAIIKILRGTRYKNF